MSEELVRAAEQVGSAEELKEFMMRVRRELDISPGRPEHLPRFLERLHGHLSRVESDEGVSPWAAFATACLRAVGEP